MTRFLFSWIDIINPAEVPTRQLEDLSWRLKKEGELMKTMREAVLYLYWAPSREMPNYQKPAKKWKPPAVVFWPAGYMISQSPF